MAHSMKRGPWRSKTHFDRPNQRRPRDTALQENRTSPRTVERGQAQTGPRSCKTARARAAPSASRGRHRCFFMYFPEECRNGDSCSAVLRSFGGIWVSGAVSGWLPTVRLFWGRTHCRAFELDACEVSNAHFGEFVRATRYVTESERFGWQLRPRR